MQTLFCAVVWSSAYFGVYVGSWNQAPLDIKGELSKEMKKNLFYPFLRQILKNSMSAVAVVSVAAAVL